MLTESARVRALLQEQKRTQVLDRTFAQLDAGLITAEEATEILVIALSGTALDNRITHK